MPPSFIKDPAGNAGDKKATIYLHIPFCKSKCHYCSFNSYAGRTNEIGDYFKALNSQMRDMAAQPWSQNRSFFSLYIGGGTPTICDSALLADLIKNCLRLFHFTDHPEITVETNPNTISTEKLYSLVQTGANRLSIGVQSFSNSLLLSLGRSHTADEAKHAFTMARQAGFTNISMDLMYGLPGQTLQEWRHSLEIATSLDPEHLSLYELMVEEGTPMAAKIKGGGAFLPGEDDVADMEELTASLLAAKGLKRYEISNFAKPVFTSQHNIHYWQNLSWIGMGAGATGSLSGIRMTNVPDPATYIENIRNKQNPYSEMECLCRQSRFRETVIMGLRMIEGIRIDDLEKRFAMGLEAYYGDTLKELTEQKLLEISNGFLRLTAAALTVANQVLARLV